MQGSVLLDPNHSVLSSLNYDGEDASAADKRADWLAVRYCLLCAAIDTDRMYGILASKCWVSVHNLYKSRDVRGHIKML